jgi:hypothetical protein
MSTTTNSEADNVVRMTFGMHKGIPLDDIPASYLLWLIEEDVNVIPAIRDYLVHNEKGIRKQVEDGLGDQ